MDILINYADVTFRQAQKFSTWMGYRLGKFDKVLEYSPEKLDADFKKKNQDFFLEGDRQRGKYGLWRPYIIMDAISRQNEGDYICYCDSGACFIRNFGLLKEFMQKKDLDLLCFDLPLMEYQWSKRDIFLYFDCDNKETVYSNQRCSTYFVFRINEFTKKFFREFYHAATDCPNLFSDAPNSLGKDNYSGFMEHRHNQSVFSILTKKYRIKSYRDISEFGRNPGLYSYTGAEYKPVMHKDSEYPQMVVLHRINKFTFLRLADITARFILPVRSYYNLHLKIQTMKNGK